MLKMSRRLVWEEPQEVSAGTEKNVVRLSDIGSQKDLSDFKVLDFGCGNGRYMDVFAKYIPKKNIFGAEVIEKRVKEVRAKGYSCIQLQAKEACLDFPNEEFDLVFSSNVFEHIKRKLYLKYLVEIHRVLKLNGRLVVGIPNYPIKRLYDIKTAFKSEFTRYYLFDDPTHCNKMSVLRLEKDLRKFFKDINLYPSYIFFERRIPLLKREDIRHRLRILGYKISGYCVKRDE